MADVTPITLKTKVIKIEEGENKGMQIPIPQSMGHLSIKSTDVPDIKSWQVGQDYKVEVMIRQTSMRKPDKWEIESGKMMPTDVKAEFDIISIVIPAEQPSQKADPGATPAVNYGD